MITYREITKDSVAIVIDGEEFLAGFKAMIQRAMNTWTDAPPYLKELADQVTNSDLLVSSSLQDYYAQNKDQRKSVAIEDQWIQGYHCKHCSHTTIRTFESRELVQPFIACYNCDKTAEKEV